MKNDRCFLCLKEEWGLSICDENGNRFHSECIVKFQHANLAELHRVCLILDLDGFTIGDQFYCRELGWVNRGNECGNCKFKMPCRFRDLNDADRRGAIFVSKFVIGLPFDSRPEEYPIDCKDLAKVVEDLYLKSKSEKRNLVAFKGGHVEKDLLESLGTPSINLEHFVGPRYHELVQTGYEQASGCGQHKAGENIHCPTDECRAFFKWFTLKLQEHSFRAG